MKERDPNLGINILQLGGLSEWPPVSDTHMSVFVALPIIPYDYRLQTIFTGDWV